MKAERKNIIAARLVAARKKAGLTQAELSELLQKNGIAMSRVAVAKAEIGIRPVKDIEVVAIAKVLDVKVEWLLYRP